MPNNCCEWAITSPLLKKYHDTEWGVPLHDDIKLFEFMTLDTFQAGLSWEIVLKKRDAFYLAFDGFNPKKISKYTPEKIESLLQNKDIIRNKLKINATVNNAQVLLNILEEWDSFDRYLWQFTNHQTIHNKWKSLKEIPSVSPEAEKMSKALKKKGFKFVGPTICYAFMQAAGMVNDHEVTCSRYKEIIALTQ
ncbi:DNA-3-methyladenine glycosylase I [Marinilabiliaceae bacterium JC017]|nr:DNA-3-methyladenine glycosylase I [Marinilabiliaceae bacterium JC017]